MVSYFGRAKKKRSVQQPSRSSPEHEFLNIIVFSFVFVIRHFRKRVCSLGLFICLITILKLLLILSSGSSRFNFHAHAPALSLSPNAFSLQHSHAFAFALSLSVVQRYFLPTKSQKSQIVPKINIIIILTVILSSKIK